MANSKEHLDKIIDNWNDITSDVEMKYIVDLLIQKRVISPTDWDDMKKAHPLTKDQMQAFLTFLQKQPKSSFKTFIEALKESGKYNHIVEILQHPVSRHQTSMQDQNHFNPTNFRRLWEEFHNSKRENDRRLEAMKPLEATNKEIYNLKILVARRENEIEELKKKNLKKEEKIAKISKDFIAEKQHREEAESKLKNAEEDLEKVRREKTELINLSRTTIETERLLKEETEFKLRRYEEELDNFRKRENDRTLEAMKPLEAMNKEIYNLKILVARRENEIEELKKKNLKKEEKIAKISIDFIAEKQHREEAESKLKNAEEDLEKVRRENTELINLTIETERLLKEETIETERLLKEETEFKLRRHEEELDNFCREKIDLSSSNFKNTKTGSDTRLGKHAKSNQQMTTNRHPSVRTENVESFRFHRHSEQNINLMPQEVETSSTYTASDPQLVHLNRQLQIRTLERDELERRLKKSSICSIL